MAGGVALGERALQHCGEHDVDVGRARRLLEGFAADRAVGVELERLLQAATEKKREETRENRENRKQGKQ